MSRVPDVIFEHPRLTAIYDTLIDPDRSDLDVYVAIADELGARSVLDVGCGTGTFALMLADRGFDVTGVDPAGGSLAVARAKRGADRVRWIHGDASALPSLQVDVATMTGNVAQAIVDEADWDRTLQGAGAALRPGGHLVFETRDPADEAWQRWNRADTYRAVELAGVGGSRELDRADRCERAVGQVSVHLEIRRRRGGVDVGLDTSFPRAWGGSGIAGVARLPRGRDP